jgi:hypothetical protein
MDAERRCRKEKDMTTKSKLMTLIAAGMLVSSVAARAQYAIAPDPNLGPTTADAEALIPSTAANTPQIATAPDANLGHSEAEIAPTSPGSPQLAMVPDVNFGESASDEAVVMQSSRGNPGVSGSTETMAQ